MSTRSSANTNSKYYVAVHINLLTISHSSPGHVTKVTCCAAVERIAQLLAYYHVIVNSKIDEFVNISELLDC